MQRGALIVVEGVDRSGKSTQCKKLIESLKKRQINAQYLNFPARNTEIGKAIDSYLGSKNNLPDETVHLLFSANRWEKVKDIINTLEQGITLIVDRYCYSGVAFSAAKGLDINWCKSPDVGLPKPDKVFFFSMPVEMTQQRNGYGNERYEVLDFQKQVSKMFVQLKQENWEIVDATRTIEVIQEELSDKISKIVEDVKEKPIGKVWTES